MERAPRRARRAAGRPRHGLRTGYRAVRPCPGVGSSRSRASCSVPLRFPRFRPSARWWEGGGARARRGARSGARGLCCSPAVHGCKPLDDAPLMYRSVVVPVSLFAQAFADHTVWRRVPARRRPAYRFKSVVVRDVALSACMTGCTRSPGPIPRVTRSRRRKRWALSRRRRGIASAAAEPPAPEAPSAANVRGRGLEERLPRASLDDLARCAKHCRATTSSACFRGRPHAASLPAGGARERARDLLAAKRRPGRGGRAVGVADQAHMGRVQCSRHHPGSSNGGAHAGAGRIARWRFKQARP
ncbi:MAG: AraC family transcriptional regulator [Eggerthella lenta]